MKKLNKTFKINPLYESDGYKVGHKAMLAKGTTRLYGTWIGCGLAGGDKSIVKGIIKKELKDCKITMVNYEL